MSIKFSPIIFGSCAAAALSCGLLFADRSLSASSDGSLPGTGVEVTSAYTLLGERFQMEVVSMGLEQMGYEVDIRELDIAVMFSGLASGEVDFISNYWENLQSVFYEKGGGESTMTVLGLYVPQGLQGYLIDKATADEYDITNLSQFQDPEIAQLFDHDGDGKADLTGCNLGWACEEVIAHHLDAYDLGDTVTQNSGKYDTLLVDTITNFEQGNSILYYGFVPYWIGGVLEIGRDVVWLEVPFTSLPDQGALTEDDTTALGKNLGFAVDNQRFVVNNEFLKANPAVEAFFEVALMSADDISKQNFLMQEGEDSEADIRRHAEEWVARNQEEFDAWVEQAINSVNSVN